MEIPKSIEIIHPYSDAFKTKVRVYSLNELLAEKLRSILQQKTRVPRPRDFYDAWYILKHEPKRIDQKKVVDVFRKKCDYKKVVCKSSDDFFETSLIVKNKQAWKASLDRQLQNPVDFDQMIEDLKSLVSQLPLNH